MNLNNGDMFPAMFHSMHVGSHDFNTKMVVHCGMKHVTIVEIHMMILDVCACV